MGVGFGDSAGQDTPIPPTPVMGVFSRRDRSAEDRRHRAATAPISPAHTLVTADHRPDGEDEKKRKKKR